MKLYDVTFLFQILHILLDEKSPTQFRIILWLMLFTDYRLKCSKIIWSTISSRRQVAASLGWPENSLDNKAHEEKIRNNLTVKIPVTVQVDRFQATCSCLCALSNDVCPKKRTSQRNKQWDLISSEWQGPVVVMLPPPLLKKILSWKMQLCCILQIVLWMWAYGNYSRQSLVFFSKYADGKHGLVSSTVKSRNVTKQTYLLTLDYMWWWVSGTKYFML